MEEAGSLRRCVFEKESKRTQKAFCDSFTHLTTKLRAGFAALLMPSLHVWSCRTCPLCTIDQALLKLVTKA